MVRKKMKNQYKKYYTEKTLKKWEWHFLSKLEMFQEIVIVWRNRHINDRGADDIMTASTIDIPFQQMIVPNFAKKGKK